VNDGSCYVDWQLEQMENNERQDVDTLYCYDCGQCFSEKSKTKKVSVERIEEIMKDEIYINAFGSICGERDAAELILAELNGGEA